MRLLLIFIIFLWCSCQQEISDNPFDNEWSYSYQELIDSGYTFLNEECGIETVGKWKNNFAITYVFKRESSEYAIAKGFLYRKHHGPFPNRDSALIYAEQLARTIPDIQELNKKIEKFEKVLHVKSVDYYLMTWEVCDIGASVKSSNCIIQTETRDITIDSEFCIREDLIFTNFKAKKQ